MRLALSAESREGKIRYATLGLEMEGDALEPDTQVLLLRQVYLAHLNAHHFRRAADVANQMAAIGPLRDVAHHDASRALTALGDIQGAIKAQRLAARTAPAERRSFHCWSLGSLLQFSGDGDGALAALRRGERWSHRDRALIRAHRAWVQLEENEAVEGLSEIFSDLERAKGNKGYGQLVLGMLADQMGDRRKASVHLRSFLRRNSKIDAAKAITLREELRRARTVLAEIESE